MFLVPVFALAWFPSTTSYTAQPREEIEEVVQVPEWDKNRVVGLIQAYSEVYGANLHELMVVASCESSFNVNAHNPADPDSGSYGVFQFQKRTFKMFSEELGKEMDIDNPEDQIELASWAFSKGYQHHWSCYKMRFGL